MKTLLQLLKIGFLSPRNLLCIYKAQRKHGMNITMILYYGALRYGKKNAFFKNNTNTTYSDFYSQAENLAGSMVNYLPGIQKQTAVLICNQHCDEVKAFFALQWLGVKTLLVNDRCHAREKQKLIDQMGNDTIVLAMQAQTDLNANLYLIPTLLNDFNNSTPVSPSKNASRIIFPTSGTTGLSKLISSKQGVFYWLQSFADLVVRTGIHKNKGVGIAVPFSNGFGYTAVLFALILGKTQAFLPAVVDTGILSNPVIDTLVGVPSALCNYSQEVKNKTHRIVKVISGGNALSKKEIIDLEQTFGRQIFSLYGSTENSVSFLAEYTHIKNESTALGKPLQGIQYRLALLPNAGIELEIKSPLANLHSDWYKTGDLVARNAQGILYWVGRKDRMLIINGVNIYPEEIEFALCQLYYIKDALVLGELKAEGLCEITAYIITHEAYADIEQRIKTDLKQSLTGLKIPKYVKFVSEFVYTTTGKKQLPYNSAESAS